MTALAQASSRRSATTFRWVRQFHLWIGAWGALAAILYGITGLVMNHRFSDGAWPQGESSETGRSSLQVPVEARATAEQLSLWLLEAKQLDATNIRKGSRKGGGSDQPIKWNLSGGTAGNSWAVEYLPGSDSAELKQSSHSPLAAFNRLHKGVGGGAWWILLADSFAIGMLLLGISGIWMWARGRSPREMALSVMGLSTLVFLALVALALL